MYGAGVFVTFTGHPPAEHVGATGNGKGDVILTLVATPPVAPPEFATEHVIDPAAVPVMAVKLRLKNVSAYGRTDPPYCDPAAGLVMTPLEPIDVIVTGVRVPDVGASAAPCTVIDAEAGAVVNEMVHVP